MKHVFHIMTIVFVIYELIWIISPKKSTERTREFKTLAKKEKGLPWGEMTQRHKDLILSKGIFSLVIVIWAVIGLITFNWLAFLLFLVFQFFIIAPLGKLFYNVAMYTVIHWVNSVIGFAFGVFVILNSYHLKIDLLDLFLSWFNGLENWVRLI